MPDPVAQAARAAARRLTPDHGPRLETDVEAALHARTPDAATAPDHYLDPVSLGALIVSIATLAWNIYQDRHTHGAPTPPPDTVARTIRTTLRETHTLDQATEHIIDITVEETHRPLTTDEHTPQNTP